MTSFTAMLWACLGMLLIVIMSFMLYVWTEKRVDRANELHYLSHGLVDQLRQSSDDLTRMARSYAVTGDPRFRAHYVEIIEIREGRVARPPGYDNVYWDRMLEPQRQQRQQQQRQRPARGGAKPTSLMENIRRAGFTAHELSLLADAKQRSDQLTVTENRALAMRDAGANDPQAITTAVAMLHDGSYHQAKAAIMGLIAAVNESVERRTGKAVEASAFDAVVARLCVIFFAAVMVTLLWRLKRSQDAALGCSVDTLQTTMARLGRGELAQALTVAPNSGDTVWASLAEMRNNLARLSAAREQALARSQRMGRLYAALSQCNQAIVRSRTEAELFDDICDAVVTHGGMSMAWIGMISADSDGRHPVVRPAASSGDGTAALADLAIPLAGGLADSRGALGIAHDSGQAYWCQDFLAAPETAAWHALAAHFNWASSASLPLWRGGRIAGFLNAYAGSTYAFDADARQLFTEMARDIEFALKNFDHERNRERAEALLRKSERHLRTIIETEPECIKLVDASGQLLEMNAAGLAILEADTLEQLQQVPLTDLILPEYRDAFIALHQRVIGGESGRLEFKVRGLKGGVRWLETHAAPMVDEQRMLLGITRDITDRKIADERIQFLAHFDALTGLPNRAQLQEYTLHALAHARRGQESMALMMLDLDHFKDINDSLGHSVGDSLLCALSGRLRQDLREEELLARQGGDEFILVLPGADAKQAAQVARKIMELIGQPFQVGVHELRVTASIGIALYPADGGDMETLLQRADAAMYQVKQAGRHDFRFFTAAMQQRAARHLQLVNALRFALERGQLEVVYQPQVALPREPDQAMRIIGAEALLRWQTPELGSVSPAEFIPAAEESGLILPIGAWVLRQGVRQARAWLDAGLPALVMAINLSATQFRNTELPELVSRILREEGLPPEYLELELTEGVALSDPQGAIAMMNNLHERGVRMSIDDFGTGFSSLSHLKKFKIYKLKIDKSFVRDISTDAEDKAIVSAIINMSRSLGLRTIAEGVETAEQLEFLRQQGCDEMQGYYFSKPLTPAAFRRLLEG